MSGEQGREGPLKTSKLNSTRGETWPLALRSTLIAVPVGRLRALFFSPVIVGAS